VRRRWNPWRALREQADVVLVRSVPLAGPRGLAIVFADGEPVVALDPELGRVERRSVLAHELVHLERGLLPADAPEHVVAKEERQVDDEAARRLVPVDELRAVAASLLDVAETVEAWQLAEHFDVTEAVIHQRVDELRRRHAL
jgi:Zn-dependent peptidase ImmA (M78 family)